MRERTGRLGGHWKSMTDDIPTIRRILKENHTIAMVGLSADWFRPSYFAAKYLQDHGFRVIPVNPRYEEILDKCRDLMGGDRRFRRYIGMLERELEKLKKDSDG